MGIKLAIYFYNLVIQALTCVWYTPLEEPPKLGNGKVSTLFK